MTRSHHALSRRDALRLFTGAGITFLSSRWMPADVSPPAAAPHHAKLSPELTEGPFYIDIGRIRRDITEGKPGVPLRMKVRVVNGVTGATVLGAAVDVWHCDAQGAYSGYAQDAEAGHFHGPPTGGPDGGGPEMAGDFHPDGQHGPMGPPPHQPPENQETFLRGVQLADAQGLAEIDTIFPGWYEGRTTHIHVRVHVGGSIAAGRYEGGHISHTGQLFFPEEMTSAIYTTPAYARSGGHRLRQDQDGIFVQDGRVITPLRTLNPARLAAGVVAKPILVIDPSATPQPAAFA